jgi:hypothetical protein
MNATPPTVQPTTRTWQGARDLDRATAAAAAAGAQIEQARADEARALAQLRVQQAQQEATEQDRQRRQERRDADAQARRDRRRAHRAAVRASWGEHRALAAVLPMMVLSAATAIPAQYDSYQQLTGQDWAAAVMSAMVEGGTWLGAALESAAHAKDRPVGRFRALTWGLAAVAAAVNVQHGLNPGHGHTGRWDMAAVFAAASLLGPLCWAAYAHLRHGRVQDKVPGSRRLRVLCVVRYPRLSWHAVSLRAASTATGAALTAEQAWALAWRERGKPAIQAPAKHDQGADDDQGEDQPAVVQPATVDVHVLDHVPAEDPIESGPVDRPAIESGPVTAKTRRTGRSAETGRPVGTGRSAGTGRPVGTGRSAGTGRPVETGRTGGSDRVETGASGQAETGRSRRSPEQIRVDAVAALAAGALSATSSRTTVRDVLGLSWKTAGSVHEQLPALAAEVAEVPGQTSIDDALAEQADEAAESAAELGEPEQALDGAGPEPGEAEVLADAVQGEAGRRGLAVVA